MIDTWLLDAYDIFVWRKLLSIIVETTRELDVDFDYNRNAYLFKEQYRAN
ncbi:hypothetical protein JDW15_04730 [Aerococcaceae bacterium zg-ZJ1578]|nr:hypothetical protein [Aerococcaceae bacterium zg-1578]